MLWLTNTRGTPMWIPPVIHVGMLADYVKRTVSQNRARRDLTIDLRRGVGSALEMRNESSVVRQVIHTPQCGLLTLRMAGGFQPVSVDNGIAIRVVLMAFWAQRAYVMSPG